MCESILMDLMYTVKFAQRLDTTAQECWLTWLFLWKKPKDTLTYIYHSQYSIICLTYVLQRVYVACARQIKRIDSITKSPIYAFFSETLNGTSTIRAYRQQQRFISHSDLLLDNSQSVWFEAFSSNRSAFWFPVYTRTSQTLNHHPDVPI